MSTHTYELKVDGITWEGELDFDGGRDISYSIDNEVSEICIDAHKKILDMFKAIGIVVASCGVVDKIEITKK